MTDVESPELEAHIALKLGGHKPFKLEVKSAQRILTAVSEIKVAASLLPAMNTGKNLTIEEPLDPTFAGNIETIQNIYSTWYDDAKRISVHAGVESSTSTYPGRVTGSFFTGGVDSFYTLLKHKEKIDALVFVHGFDVNLTHTPLRRQVSNMIHHVADQFDKKVFELETNLRDWSNDHAAWGHYHGAALATMGLALSGVIDKIYIPSSRPYNNLAPWGSSPLLDPLWSTSKLRFIHDGCEANRVEKCKRVSENEVAIENLRVCWENREGAYNCGKCEKCIRTMVQLLAAGALDQCGTFSEPLDPSRISKLSAVREYSFRYLPALRILESENRAPEVIAAIRQALKGPSLGEQVRQKGREAYRNLRHLVGNRLRAWGIHE